MEKRMNDKKSKDTQGQRGREGKLLHPDSSITALRYFAFGPPNSHVRAAWAPRRRVRRWLRTMQ